MTKIGPANEDSQKEKKASYKIKITSYLTGKNKDIFMSDLIRRGIKESELIRDIIDLHYKILNHYSLENKEFKDVKNQLL